MIFHPNPHGPAWISIGAICVLVLHIGAGIIGLAAGAAALLAGKGGRLHRLVGICFAIAMLMMTAIGAATAPLLPQQTSVIMGLFTFYLVATGWMAAIRRDGQIGRPEVAGLAGAVAIATLSVGFALYATTTATGQLGGDPPSSYLVLGLLPGLAGLADARSIRRGTLTQTQRIRRHIWRLCAALFIASFSFFIGQQRVFPPLLRGSLVMLVPEVLVLGTMIFWLVRIRTAAPRHRVLPGTKT